MKYKYSNFILLIFLLLSNTVFGNYSKETVLENDILVCKSILELRKLDLNTISMLKSGQIKAVQVLGYYNMGDTPNPIYYYLSNSKANDDGGGVIHVNNVVLEHDFKGKTIVEYYGIRSGSVEYANTNAKILNRLISEKMKIYLCKEIYYFDEVEVTDESVTEVYLEGESFTGGGKSGMNTTIKNVNGSNFLVFKKKSSTRPIIKGIHFVNESKLLKGNCIIQEFGVFPKSDFFVNVEKCNFYNWDKAIYTDGYATSVRVIESYFGNNRIGIWSELHANFGRIELCDFISNGVALHLSGYQTVINQNQICLNGGSSPLSDGKVIGIWCKGGMTTISNIYHEEYGGIKGMTPDKYIFIKLKVSPNEPNEHINISNTTFVFEKSITNIEITGSGDNLVSIEGGRDWYLPKSIKYTDGLLGRGISINGSNFYRNSNTTVMNKREFRLTKAIGYISDFKDNFKSIKFDRQSIIGLDNIVNNKSQVSWQDFFNDKRGAPVLQFQYPEYNSTKFIIDYDFKLDVSSAESTYVFQLLKSNNKYVHLQAAKSIQVDKNKFTVFFKGKYEGDLDDLHSGALYLGFKDYYPLIDSFDGYINIVNQ